MTINDLVLPLETCKRLKQAGYEFPESVFVWLINDDGDCFPVFRDEMRGREEYEFLDTLTLHEVYCWVLELSKIPQFRGDTPQIKFIYGDTDMEDRIIFSAGSQTHTGRSTELSPILAADRYINNLLDKGVLKK